MKTKRVANFPNNLPRLMNVIAAEIPELAPRFNEELQNPETRTMGAYEAVFQLSGTEDSVEFLLPDDFDETLLDPVLAAHDPLPDVPPIQYQRARTEFQVIRTTNGVAKEIFRYPFPLNSGASFTFTFIATDAGNGAIKKLKVDLTGKRLASGIAQVGATTVLVNHADTAAVPWSIAPAIEGTDFVVKVTGAAGRSIDWGMEAAIYSFAPGGFADSG